MKVEDGQILEATEAEIREHWESGLLRYVVTLEAYIALLRYEGAVITREETT